MKYILKLLLFSTLALAQEGSLAKQLINEHNCDQVLHNDGYFLTCYDYKAKGAKYVAYTLDSKLINKANIKKRPRFYPDKNIPKRFRSEPSDYTHNLYNQDRGHLANDAAFDYSHRSLHAVYVMSNIIPQASTINRSKSEWAGAERYERAIAVKLGKINVLNGVVYSKKLKRIGRNQIAIPESFWKMIYSEDGKFKKCFYFENKQIKGKKRLKDSEVECDSLVR